MDWNEHTEEILSLMPWQTGPMAHALRKCGHDIARKCEAEQAYVMRWLLDMQEEHGDQWRKAAHKAIVESLPEGP